MRSFELSRLLLYVILLSEFVFQSMNLSFLLQKSDDKYFHRFTFLSVVFFVVSCFSLNLQEEVYDKYTDLGTGLLIYAVLFFYALISVILLISGIIARTKRIKNGMIKKGIFSDIKFISLITVITILLNVFVALPLPKILVSSSYKDYPETTIEYLNTKYGDHNFKVCNTYDDVEYQGFTKVSYGICVVVSSDVTSKNFNILFDERTKEILEDKFLATYFAEQCDLKGESDSYLSGFFSEKIREDYPDFETNNKNGIELNRAIDKIFYKNYNGITGDVIPNDFGKIPTVKETEKMIIEFIKSYNKKYNKK